LEVSWSLGERAREEERKRERGRARERERVKELKRKRERETERKGREREREREKERGCHDFSSTIIHGSTYRQCKSLKFDRWHARTRFNF
jgi:hypothetical protein